MRRFDIAADGRFSNEFTNKVIVIRSGSAACSFRFDNLDRRTYAAAIKLLAMGSGSWP
jgi:hypothetical protein